MKISIQFFDDIAVRAFWDEQNEIWRYSAVDIVGVLRNNEDHKSNRNYWKYFKNKLRNENNELVSHTIQLKLKATDNKYYLTDTFTAVDIIELAKMFPAKEASRFIDWFTNSLDSLDSKSKLRAYALFESELLANVEAGTTEGLKQIHGYLFGGLFDFAGKIRTKNIAKGGFAFAAANYLKETLNHVERMPHSTFEEIVSKYIEMNIAHPFMEGNGRSMRIWLDLMLKKSLSVCVDWSLINKDEYLLAMRKSVLATKEIMQLLNNALTSNIDDRQVFMKGIDYSYYYEQENDILE